MNDSAHPSAIIKIGGSLLDWPELPDRLKDFLTSELDGLNRIVFIAGGGRIVDVIRDLDHVHRFGEAGAHALAIDALDLTARILGRLLHETRVIIDDDEIRACWDAGLIPILAPGHVLRRFASCADADLPSTWDVTSDSIAAWIAVQLRADRLILLKSTELPVGLSRSRAAAAGLVDAWFAPLAHPLTRVAYRNLRDHAGGLIELPDQE
jgi:aspartokinase-like uncharacterized kinase